MLAFLINFLVILLCLNVNKKITGSTRNDGKKEVIIIAPFKYLSNFWRNCQMSLINCEIDLILTWSTNYVISNAAANQATIFAITDTKFSVPFVILLTRDNATLLQQLKSEFKRTINWKKHQRKTTTQNAPNQYLDYLIDSSFPGVNIICFLAFSANDSRIGHSRYYLLTSKGEDYNIMIDRKLFYNFYEI